jgi:hypothetical protein
MQIPGSNLLNMALKVITPQTLAYYEFNGRSLNSIGYTVATYAPGVTAYGSLQPIPRNLYESMGLDLQRDYCMIFVSKGVIDVERDVSGDMMIYQGTFLQCVSVTNWFRQDGWDQVLAVRVPSAPWVDTVSPPADGDYTTGQAITFELTFSGAVIVTGTPYLPITIGAGSRQAAYLSGSGTRTLTFMYTVVEDDSGVLAMLSPISGNLGAANTSFIVPDTSGVTVNA